jgi:uncharacterized protein
MDADQSLSPLGQNGALATDWPAWAAPLALAGGLVLGAFAALLVDLPALLFGIRIDGPHLPAGLELVDTVVQDVVFVLVAVRCARLGNRVVRTWQFGLRPPRLEWWKTALLVAVALIGFVLFSALWSAVLGENSKEKLLEQLGANESVLLLICSATLTCVVAPICEEFLFRGFAFQALRNWRGFSFAWLGLSGVRLFSPRVWRGPLPAAVITGILFGLFHLGSAPAADLVPLGVFGFLLCIVRWRTGSLYPCIAAHCINNSIAYGSLEEWRWWQVVVLMCAALTLIMLLALILRRVGLISAPPTWKVIPQGT